MPGGFLCSFWRCWGPGDSKVAADNARRSTREGLLRKLTGQSDCLKAADHVKDRPGDSGDDHDSAFRGEGHGEKGQVDSAKPNHTASADPHRQERLLRALLQKAKQALAQQTQSLQQQQIPAMESARRLDGARLKDPEVVRLNKQLVDAASTPRPDARSLMRVELLLGELRRWLRDSGPTPGAATALIYSAGEGLAHAEHAVRSAGQVRFWRPDAVAAFVALVQLYGDLLVQAGRAAPPGQQQARLQELQGVHPQQQAGSGGEREGAAEPARPSASRQPSRQASRTGSSRNVAWVESAPAAAAPCPASDPSPPSSRAPPASSRPGSASQPSQHPPQHPLTFIASALFLRPDWLDLLSDVLELLHFNDEYAAAASAAGRPASEAAGAALALWGFLTQLVKFASEHAVGVQRLNACLQRLGSLLSPPSGALPRLLALAPGEHTLSAQLHAMWLLQVLYDMPDSKVLYTPALADHYVALHHGAMVSSYEASAADPRSAAAELCRIHATLLRSLARHPGQPVRSAFARAGTAAWLLAQVTLESSLLPAAAAEEEQAADRGASSDDSLSSSEDEDEDGDDAGDGKESGSDAGPAGAATEAGEGDASEAGGAGGGTSAAGGAKSGKSFAYTYDLNEDLERLMALEDELGEELELDGFEYDEEGRQLKAKSDARLAAAAAAAAVAAVNARKKAARKGGGGGADGGADGDGDGSSRTGTSDGACQRHSASGDSADGAASVSDAPLGSAHTSRTHADGGGAASGGCGLSLAALGASGGGSGSGGIPRLALGGLRAGSVSSLAGIKPVKPSRSKKPLGGRSRATSHAAPSDYDRDETADAHTTAAHSDTGEEDGDGDEELMPEEAMTPTMDPAAAAERIARWRTTILEDPPPPPGGVEGDGAPSELPPRPSAADLVLPPRPGGGGPRSLPGQAPAATATANSTQRSVWSDGAAADGGGGGPPPRLGPLPSTHPGPHGDLQLLVPGQGQTSNRAAGPNRASLPPLASRPVVPPLRVGASASASGGGGGTEGGSASASARGGGPQSSRAMVLLSASNRAHYNGGGGGGVGSSGPSAATLASPSGTASGQAPDANRNSLAQLSSVRLMASGAGAGAGGGGEAQRPSLVPSLNFASLRRRDGGGGGPASSSDTGRTLPLSSILRTHPGSLPGGSAMDPFATPPSTAALRGGGGGGSGSVGGGGADGAAGTPLQRILEAEPYAEASGVFGSAFGYVPTATGVMAAPPVGVTGAAPLPAAAQYQEGACRRLLYQDPATHVLLLKILMDLLVTPAGALDPAVAPKNPADAGLPHAEFTLLWHLNAPRNAGVVRDLCKGAQRRASEAASAAAAASSARRTAAAAAAAASGVGGASVLHDSARDHPRTARSPASSDSTQPLSPGTGTGTGPTAIATSTTAAAVAAKLAPPAPQPDVAVTAALAATRPAAVMRTLQLLTRAFFDASRYSNLQFVARGAFGGIYRARMDPPRAQTPALRAPPQPLTLQHAAALTVSFALAGPDKELAAAPAPSPAPLAAVPSPLPPGPPPGAAVQSVQVVIKTIQLPSSAFDGCVLPDVYGEVAIMERFRGCEGICQLLDYGMHDDAYWIVMRRYRCSLAEWRGRQKPLSDLLPPASLAAPPGGTSVPGAVEPSLLDTPTFAAADAAAAAAGGAAAAAAAARVYLSALAQVAESLALLAANHVVHFDLKCANVLIEPLPGVKDGELWAPVGTAVAAAPAGAGGEAPAPAPAPAAGLASSPGRAGTVGGGASPGRAGSVSAGGSGVAVAGVPFRCVLADFGEARAYRSAAEAFTSRNRGTEVFKSPEMLLLNARSGRLAQAPSPLAPKAPAPAAAEAAAASPTPAAAATSSSAAGLTGPASPAAGILGSPSARLPPLAGRSPSRPTSAASRHAPDHPHPHTLQQHSLAGAGLASDVWSFGCLAYELLSGCVLFGGDYASVTHRVAFGSGDHLVLTEAERGKLAHLPPLVGLVEGILARDPARRPSVGQIKERIEAARRALAALAAQ
ncbi:hypothetical protein HYH03_007854 [Edaphochlamys debaryana]|uniref:Protein kinase domain-containing protein n=1 Tax=Edaphochlamys debaryana TaxID=47281 RepID=A0A836BZZ0_9CHLO|nr:hypothetical protein HYH03_007854 [Edaphochlamys debaryana]|eukprot:KAG2493918.1 hypothetical protein HYH03_007854 [Edaphochlamys debaryana]